eukprot:GHVO01014726.1.p1 GENE.GHVO01014726.1~~GHVO01014726.1.p1  ORF type:complete len:140 (-),score=42.09 GHVO01014726.1:676-1095(-)
MKEAALASRHIWCPTVSARCPKTRLSYTNRHHRQPDRILFFGARFANSLFPPNAPQPDANAFPKCNGPTKSDVPNSHIGSDVPNAPQSDVPNAPNAPPKSDVPNAPPHVPIAKASPLPPSTSFPLERTTGSYAVINGAV